MTRVRCVLGVVFLSLTAVGQINLNQGQPLGAGASGLLTTIPEVHSSLFPGDTLQTLVSTDCPSFPCRVVLDAGSTINADNAVIGSSTNVVQVVDHGQTINCNGTGGASDNCIAIDQLGSLVCDSNTNGGCAITMSATANIGSMITNNTQTGAQTNFTLRGFTVVPAGQGTLANPAVSIVSIEGQADIRDMAIFCHAGGVALGFADSVSGTGDNNNISLDNVSLLGGGSSQDCTPLRIWGPTGGSGHLIGLTYKGGAIVDTSTVANVSVTSFTGSGPGTLSFTNSGTNNLVAGELIGFSGFSGGAANLNGSTALKVSSTGLSSTTFQVTTAVTTSGSSTGTVLAAPCPNYDTCMVDIDGTSALGNNNYVSGITFIGTYFESKASGQSGSFLEAKNFRGVNLVNVQFNGGVTLTNCVWLGQSSGGVLTGSLDVTGPDKGAQCTNQINNTIDGYISSVVGATAINYHYTGVGMPFTVDGPLSVLGGFGSAQTNTASACETNFGITTLNTTATTTNTGQSCLPVNAIIDAVVYRITTSITTAANFQIGDSTTAGRFCSAQTTLTVGTTGICFAQADQTGAPGPRQTSATSVRVTTNVNPGAGAIRLIVHYHTWTAPTS
jgi:hypothetical protein